MKITFLGHSCLLIQANGKTIITDPFIRANELAKHINVTDLKPDYILITHAHQDHTLDVEEIANQSKTTLISNWEIVNYFEKKGIKGHPMNTGGSWNFDFGKVICTLAHHSSSFADGTYGGNPNGYILEVENKRIYIAGDTALFTDMRLIPLTIGKLDLAVLPMGDNFTMGIKDSLIASDFLECKTVLAYHYDTFGYIKLDKKLASQTFSENEKNLILLEIGQSMNL